MRRINENTLDHQGLGRKVRGEVVLDERVVRPLAVNKLKLFHGTAPRKLRDQHVAAPGHVLTIVLSLHLRNSGVDNWR